MLEGLFVSDVRVAFGDPKLGWPLAMPVEEEAIRAAVERRRREFRAGRALARQAMTELGVEPVAVPMAIDRSPVWPTKIVGSISHCEDMCVVALAQISDGIVAVGIDIEPAEPLDADLADEICGTVEHKWLQEFDGNEQGLFRRLVFSAKECAYKCQYWVTGQMLAFDAFSIRVDRSRNRFEARLNRDVAPLRAGDILAGRYRIAGGNIVTGMTLHAVDLDRSRTSSVSGIVTGAGDV